MNLTIEQIQEVVDTINKEFITEPYGGCGDPDYLNAREGFEILIKKLKNI